MLILETKNWNCKPKILKQVYNWLNYLLPPHCLLCEQPSFLELDLCNVCYQQLQKNTQHCIRCAKPLEQTDQFCGSCLKTEPYFDAVQAPFLYQEAMRYLITEFKYHNDYKNARTLGLLLAEQLNIQTPPDCIIPVPLHKTRYRVRGFNQAIELAHILSHYHHIPLNLNTCIRKRNTEQQARLTGKQRIKNVKNAFEILKPLNNQRVVIIDDVMTTGSTVNEVAKVLKKAGATYVEVWVCARA